MGHDDDQPQQATLRPWPPPRDDIERLTSQPALPGWQVILVRVQAALIAVAGAAVLVAGPPAPSLWHAAAAGALLGGLVYVPAGWLLTARGRYVLRQVVGLRPPAGRDRRSG